MWWKLFISPISLRCFMENIQRCPFQSSFSPYSLTTLREHSDFQRYGMRFYTTKTKGNLDGGERERWRNNSQKSLTDMHNGTKLRKRSDISCKSLLLCVRASEMCEHRVRTEHSTEQPPLYQLQGQTSSVNSPTREKPRGTRIYQKQNSMLPAQLRAIEFYSREQSLIFLC